MEKAIPMDRVISGDVGYGKTEIAVRAAFKAVQDGKQVVVLVPTTLLAQQHLSTFSERMSAFPVTVRGLSRFTPADESKKTIKGLADGSVDIVIGTHRLLQPSVIYKDLGLVIVDEEQRFGVEHKEFITGLRAHVDMLTMSATPIPRTLEMSLAGIREMSTIATPPEDRHPILTYVGPYDDEAGRRGDPPRVAARRAGLPGAQPGVRHRAGRGEHPRAGAGGHGRRRARADGRARAGEGHRRLLGARVRRAASAPRSSRPAWTSPTPTR